MRLIGPARACGVHPGSRSGKPYLTICFPAIMGQRAGMGCPTCVPPSPTLQSQGERTCAAATCAACLLGLRGGGGGQKKLIDMCKGTTRWAARVSLSPASQPSSMHPETGSSLQLPLACPEAALGQVMRRWAGEGLELSRIRGPPPPPSDYYGVGRAPNLASVERPLNSGHATDSALQFMGEAFTSAAERHW